MNASVFFRGKSSLRAVFQQSSAVLSSPTWWIKVYDAYYRGASCSGVEIFTSIDFSAEKYSQSISFISVLSVYNLRTKKVWKNRKKGLQKTVRPTRKRRKNHKKIKNQKSKTNSQKTNYITECQLKVRSCFRKNWSLDSPLNALNERKWLLRSE